MFQFKLPDIGEGIVEAEIVRWHVAEGASIRENEPLVEVLTDKAAVDIPSPRTGRIHRLGYQVGEIVPVGDVLVEIDDSDGGPTVVAESSEVAREETRAVSSTETSDTKPKLAEEPVSASPPAMPPRPGADPASRGDSSIGEREVRAVPAIRDLARRLEVDLSEVFGTGPQGRVMRRDIERHLRQRGRPTEGAESLFTPSNASSVSGMTEQPSSSTPEDEPEDWTRRPLRGLRRVIAERMHLSKSRAAHYTYVEEVDMTAVEGLRGDRSPLAYVAHAVLRVLPSYPLINSSLDEEAGEVLIKKRIHLGVATATDDGLLVPVIHDADKLSVKELAEAITKLSTQAREKELTSDQLRGSTFTISSLGRLGGLMATPIINYPETSILAVHAIRKLPRYVGEELQPRQVMNLSMSLDHRLIDGLEAAKFVQQTKTLLETADFPSEE